MHNKDEIKMELIRYIGCCGAYCKTCKPFIDGVCMGCKIGFDTGERDINNARCKIKLCCFKNHKLNTCADCAEFPSCSLIHDWFSKTGYKYRKYKQSIEFIIEYGYSKFIELANNWKGAYGNLR